MDAIYPGRGLSLQQLVFALSEELKRVAYSPSYVATNSLKNEFLTSPQIRFGHDLSTRPGRFYCAGNDSRVEELFRSRQPYSVGHPSSHTHPSLFPTGPLPRCFRLSSLARSLPSSWFNMVSITHKKGRGLHVNSPQARKRIRPGRDHLSQSSPWHYFHPFSPFSANQAS